MITRAQKVRLGVFLVVSAGLLVGTLLVVAGLRVVAERDLYTVRFEGSVSGLEVGAQVKYNGVRVGTVESIGIDRGDVSLVVVELSLAGGTPIKADTRAVLSTTGITGLKEIELTLGSNDARFLEPGAEIPAGESLLDKLTGQAEAIGQKAELLLNRLNKVLDEDNREALGRIIANVDDLTAQATAMLEENRESLRAFTSSLAEAGAGLQATLDGLDREALATLAALRQAAEGLQGVVDKERVGRILANVERLSASLSRSAGDLDVEALQKQVGSLTAKAEDLLGNVDLMVLRSREDLYASLTYLLEGMENFSEFARMLRENPSLLLRGPAEEERTR